MRASLWLGSLAAVCAAGPVVAGERSDTAAPPQAVVIRGAQVVGRPMKPLSLDVDLRDLPRGPRMAAGRPDQGHPAARLSARDAAAGGTSRIPPPTRCWPLQPEPPGAQYPRLRRADPQLRRPELHGREPARHGGRRRSRPLRPGHQQLEQQLGASSTTRPPACSHGGPVHHVQPRRAGPVQRAASAIPSSLYDGLADRWLLAEFAGSGNNLCVYISKTPNPVTGGWWFYRLGHAPPSPTTRSSPSGPTRTT